MRWGSGGVRGECQCPAKSRFNWLFIRGWGPKGDAVHATAVQKGEPHLWCSWQGELGLEVGATMLAGKGWKQPPLIHLVVLLA